MARHRGSQPDATIRTLQRAVEQATHVLDHQFRGAENQSRLGEQAARFAVAIVLFGIAVVGVVAPMGWEGPRWALNLTGFLLTLFFVQGIVSAVGLLVFSVAYRRNTFPVAGATPGSLRKAAVAKVDQLEEEFLLALLEHAHETFEENRRSIEHLSSTKDLLVTMNILSLPWFVIGMIIYTSFWILGT